MAHYIPFYQRRGPSSSPSPSLLLHVHAGLASQLQRLFSLAPVLPRSSESWFAEEAKPSRRPRSSMPSSLIRQGLLRWAAVRPSRIARTCVTGAHGAVELSSD